RLVRHRPARENELILSRQIFPRYRFNKPKRLHPRSSTILVVPSSAWPLLTGASIAYGLTEGGVNASAIKLTPLGRKLVAPEEEGQDITARREAILRPRIIREFFERYRRAKFPSDLIAGNVLKTLGLPGDRIQSALEIIKANGRYAGIIRETPT